MALLIQISCRKRTGKTTFANMLIPQFEKSGFKTIHTSFVEPARKYVAKVFPDCPDTDENKDEYREKMIAICKATLDIDELAFTKSLVELVKNTPDDTIIFAPDLRRRCEYDYVQEQLVDESITIRIDRGEIPKENSFGEGDMDDDNLYDMIIDNNGTLEELNLRSQIVYQELMTVYKENT
jgi:hypothetical protein